MEKDATFFVAGGDSLIGNAVARALALRGCHRVLGAGSSCPPLHSGQALDAFFATYRPQYVFFVGGKSGGIAANMQYPADLMLHNLKAAVGVLEAAWRYGVNKLLYLASSCSYPRSCPQPMREEYLLAGPLEPTNEAYAVAKIAGLKLCQAFRRQYGAPFICAIPANVYGPGDDFSPKGSHVVAALLRRMHEARLKGAQAVEVWGTGTPQRDFLYVSDCASACLYLMEHYESDVPINIGSGKGLSIAQVAEAAKEVTGFSGTLLFNQEKPDGMPVKVLDIQRIRALGWRPQVDFPHGLAETYAWYRETAEGHRTDEDDQSESALRHDFDLHPRERTCR